MLLNAGIVAASAGLAITPEILWLEADYGVTESGGAVSAWGDRSTNAYSFTQSTPSSRPTITANVLNGHPVLRFDGGDWLSMSTTLLNTSGATANIYVVADHRGGTTGAILSTRPLSGATGWSWRYNSATSMVYYHTGQTPGIDGTIADQYNLLEVQRAGLSVALGAGGILSTATTISGYSGSSSPTYIGAEAGATSAFLNGDIAAIIIATSNRAGILDYLQDKYGV